MTEANQIAQKLNIPMKLDIEKELKGQDKLGIIKPLLYRILRKKTLRIKCSD